MPSVTHLFLIRHLIPRSTLHFPVTWSGLANLINGGSSFKLQFILYHFCYFPSPKAIISFTNYSILVINSNWIIYLISINWKSLPTLEEFMLSQIKSNIQYQSRSFTYLKHIAGSDTRWYSAHFFVGKLKTKHFILNVIVKVQNLN